MRTNPLILSLDTATSRGTIAISRNGTVLSESTNEKSSDHAAWLHPAIASLLETTGLKLSDLDAIAVVGGPGSYTGLRVAMAAAKGFCYALSIPLISLNTLELMASAAIDESTEDALFCPMLDARRMEVFTALYDRNLHAMLAPQPMILEIDSFATWLNGHTIIFFGNGSDKYQPMLQDRRAIFRALFYAPTHIAKLALREFNSGRFADLAYVEPLYLKEFYTPGKLHLT